MHNSLFRSLVALSILLPTTVSGQNRNAPALIQANFNNPKVDALGNRWDVHSYGQIQYGQNNTFSGAGVMTVNGSSFSSRAQKMTADGTEYYISGTTAGLSITRRVKIDIKNSAVRFVDIFQNPTGAPITANIIYQTSMGRSQLQQTISETGTMVGGTLDEKAGGMIGFANPSQSSGQMSIVWDLASPRSKVKPSIRNESNYRYYFTYNFVVPPQKSKAILHGLAQRNFLTAPDAKGLKTLFKPFRSRNWTRDLPADIRKMLVNSSGSAFGDWAAGDALAALDALDVDRGAFDILAVGQKTRLRGTTICNGITVKSKYGDTFVEWERVAAILGQAHASETSAVLLRDGQVFQGSVEFEALQFNMNSGISVALAAPQLDRLITHVSPQDGLPPAGVFALLETVHGTRLALAKNEAHSLAVITPWGERTLVWDDIVQMQAAETGLGYRFKLQDGSQLFGYLQQGDISVNTLAFGSLDFNASEIRRIVPATKEANEDDSLDESALPYVSLSGDNVLVGQVDQSHLNFVLSGQPVPVPLTQIRYMRNLLEEYDGPPVGVTPPMFELELWDGGIMNGTLADRVLPVRAGNQVYHVRADNILEMHRPTPVVPESLRRSIAEQIRDLGNDEYQKRETATNALIELGQLAKQQLNNALGQTSDTEVRRRLEKILSEIDG